MREMKDSGVEWIGEIPIDWGIAKFKHFFSIIGGCGFKEEYQGESQGDYPFLKASDINGSERTVSSAKNYVNQNLVQQEKYNVVPSYSIIIAKIGEALKKNHRKINTCDCIIDNNCEAFSLIPDADSDISYLYYVLSHIDMVWFDNGGTVPSVNNEKLRDFFLPNPNNVTQHRIADYLDAKCAQIDRAIARQQEVIEKLKEYKLSVITEAVTKGLNPDVPMKDSGIEWIGEIPEGWEIKKIKHVACILNGDRGSNYPSENDYVDSGVPFIGANALCEDYLDLTDAKFISEEKYNSMGGVKIQFGDILYTLRGSTIGKNAMSTISDGTVASSLMVIRPIRILSIFLYLCLNSHIELQQRRSFINGSTAPNLSAENIGDFRIPYPPISIQEEITLSLKRFIENHSFHIKRLQQTIFKLNDYKKSLIYEVVTGKREV